MCGSCALPWRISGGNNVTVLAWLIYYLNRSFTVILYTVFTDLDIALSLTPLFLRINVTEFVFDIRRFY